ncbi:hypothetical protein LguiA_024106 [Lonicera macranthoides]
MPQGNLSGFVLCSIKANVVFLSMTRLGSCSGRLTSTLEFSRKGKQLAKGSRESCGVRPIVDGIEPVSASMLSTVDLQLKYINPELTWKKVSKGCRSTTRRSRKLANRSLNAGAEMGCTIPKDGQDSSVFESEKFGVAVLGRRFAEQVEHVPIKKRRFLLRSPSPPPRTPSPDHEDSLSAQPQTPPPQPEELGQLVVHGKLASGRCCSPDSYPNREIGTSDGSVAVKLWNSVDVELNGAISEVTNGEVGYPEDFSGIELLAAAACSSSSGDSADNIKESSLVEEFATPEGIDASTAAVPLKETIASSVEEVKGPVPLKDDRLSWDLNVVMEWDEPDDPLVSQKKDTELVLGDGKGSEKLALEGCGVKEESEDISCDIKSSASLKEESEDNRCDIESKVLSAVCKTASFDVHGNQMLLDSKDTVDLVSAKFPIGDDDKLEVFPDPNMTCVKMCFSAPTEGVLAPLAYTCADSKSSALFAGKDTSGDNSCCPETHHIESNVVKEKISSASASVMHNGEDCSRTSTVPLGKASLQSVQPVQNDFASPNMIVQDNAICGIDNIQSKEDEEFGTTSRLPDSRTSPGKPISTVTCITSDVGNSSKDLEKVDNFLSSPNYEEFSASSTSIVEVQPIAISDVKGQDGKASTAYTTVSDIPVHIQPEELIPNCDEHRPSNEVAQGGIIYQGSCQIDGKNPTICTGKLSSEDPSGECYGSDVSQEDRGRVVGVESMREHQVGYESPFEDGELRDSIAYSWDDNEVDEGENECVDYESGNGDGDDFDTVDYSENFEGREGEGGQIMEKGSSLVKNNENEEIVEKRVLEAGSGKVFGQFVKGDPLKEQHSSVTLKYSQEDQLQEHGQDRIAEGNANGLDGTRLLVVEVGSRGSMSKLSSRVEGSSSFDLIHRKENLLMQRNRSDNLGDSYGRAEREFGSDTSLGRERSFQVHGRNEAGGHWVDSSAGYWDARNRYPSNYRAEGRGYSRPRGLIANSASKDGNLNFNDDRRSINYSSKGMYRPLIRRRSPPPDRDDPYINRGTPPVRGISRDRNRGRPGGYPQGFRRGPKEEYHEPLPDDTGAPSVRMQHYSARRERGFSPNFDRGANFSRPRRKSRSRSRTRSPMAWHLQRDRNVGNRRHSPDFRSEARMEGVRLPFLKPSFSGADYEEGFISPPRGRSSPQRNTRWFDNRNCMDDDFRGRRSPPLRLLRRPQRFDSVSSYSGRLKSDSYFRPPLVRRGRSPQMSGTGRGGRKYEGSDEDRRKHDDEYETIHRVRRYDAGGVVKRFRYDAEDCLEARNNSHKEDSCFRGTIRRDVPRSAREDRGLPRYNPERVYTTVTLSEPQNYEGDASPRGG